jgi:hypothetical protein
VRPTLLLRVAAAIVGLALVASVVYAVGTIGQRPLDGVEGEVLFEADRIRSGLALYTDPVSGARDYGPVPARYFVLYPPLWAWIVSLVPRLGATIFARGVAMTAWFGLLFSITFTAPRSNRRVAAFAAAFTGGVYTLTLYGAAGRPDALAVGLAGSALLLSVRRGHVGALAAALFTLAAWTKPNVFGLAVGAVVAQGMVDLRSALRAVLTALGVSLTIASVLSYASGGAWVQHLLYATGQPASLALWQEQVPSRLQFLGLPIAFALYAGWRSRRTGSAASIGLGALVGSVAWTLLSLAKIGSATNYWMEPMVAVCVVLSRAPVRLPERALHGWAAAGAVLFQCLWTHVATIKSVPEALDAARVHRELVDRAFAACGAGKGDVVMADEPGLELMVNGRILTTPFQMTHLVRRGKVPLTPFLVDLARPEVACLLMEDDLLERPMDVVSVEHDRYGPKLRRALVAKFVRVEEQGNWHLYRARGRDSR